MSNNNQTKPTPKINWYPSPITDFMQQAMIQVSDDIELCVEVGGNPNNPPLLLIMGLGSQLIFWPDAFLERLIDAGFYIIRFDNRDIGLSSKVKRPFERDHNTYLAMVRFQLGLDNSETVKSPYYLTDMAEDTVNLINKLGFAKVNVLGVSMGGMIAQILSATHPELVDRLALIFTTNNRPFLRPPRFKQLTTLLTKPASNDEKDVVKHGKWFINRIGSPGYVDEDKVGKISKLRFERSFYPNGSVQQFDAILKTGSLRDYSKKITIPTLIMHGSADGLVPYSHGKALARDIPNAKFRLIEGMGHDLPDYYQPYIVNQLTDHMLKD